MFKNTLVDVIFKTAISSHHLKHALKQITKVDIQSRPYTAHSMQEWNQTSYILKLETPLEVCSKNVVIILLLALATLFISCSVLEVLCRTEFD